MSLATHWERDRIGAGRFRHVQHIKPIAFYNAQGRLRRIATTWQDSQVPGTHHMVMDSPFGVSVSNSGEIRYHPTWEANVGFQIGDPVYKLAGETKHFDLGIPERSQNRLTWLTEHLRMDYLHLGHAGKLGLLFRTAAYQAVDNREIAFPITYAGCTRDGRHIVIDGQRVMRLRGFLAYDYDDPLQRAPVTHEWRTVAGQEYIVVTLPLAMDAWSKPVLDPTLEVQPAAAEGKDTMLIQSQADTNYATNAQLYVQATYYRALIQFDLSSIPANATITAVTLTFQVANHGDRVYLYRILPANDWVEAEATWNVRKSGTSWAGSAGCSTAGTDHDATEAASHAPSSQTSHDWTFDANGIADVQGWVAGTFANYGLVGKGGTNDARFYSSDHATASERPKLTVEYTAAAAASDGPPLLRRQRH
jgi:hypothetical protein